MTRSTKHQLTPPVNKPNTGEGLLNSHVTLKPQFSYKNSGKIKASFFLLSQGKTEEGEEKR